MNWISKKFVLSQIKKYFQIEDEDQLDLQIIGQHKFKCINLKLKNQIVNKPASPLHVQKLFIKELYISYEKTEDEPLKVAINGITLVLTFNTKLQKEPPQYTKTLQVLKKFFEAVKRKETSVNRGFFFQEIFQLKKMVGEAIIGRLSLIIKQIDISLQYESDSQQRVLGVQLGQINIKQRMLINHDNKTQKQSSQDSLRCAFQNVSLYLGIFSNQDKIQSNAKNREVIHRVKTIKKITVIDKNQIQLFYNISKGSLSVEIKQIYIRLNKLTIYQISQLSQHLQKYLSSRPLLRPGQGEPIQVEFGVEMRQFKEGTVKWWRYIFDKVIKNVSEHKKTNIITNPKYRMYLFFIIYKYTYGSHSFIDQFLLNYQKDKLAPSIMEIYYNMLNRINLIRNSKKFEEQQDFFIQFLQCSSIVKDAQKRKGLKKLTYEDVQKSSIQFNLQNCREFIRESTSKNSLNMQLKIDSVRLNVIQNKHDISLIEDGFKLPPSIFYPLKKKYISRYYKRIIEEPSISERTVLKLQISHIKIINQRIEMKATIPQIILTNEQNDLIFKAHNLVFLKENKSLFSERNTVIFLQKNKFIKVSSIYLNLQQDFVRHLLSIKIMLSQDLTRALTEQQQFENYLHKNVYNKLSMHPNLQNYSDQSTTFEIQKVVIISSFFTQNQYLAIEVGAIKYSAPINEKQKATIAKICVSRSRVSNIDNILHHSIQKLKIEKQSILMENNKPLVINMERFARGHFVNSQQKQKTTKEFKKQQINKNKKDISYIYYEPIIDIVVPFILIQLSFLDLYYFQLIMNYWSEITNNPYYFPERLKKTQLQKQLVQLSQRSIEFLTHQDRFTRVSRTRCKFQGIQLVVFGQNKRINQNRIISVLLQGITYQDKMYILGRKKKITILNLFVENCLGNKVFNIRRLSDILLNPYKQGQPLLYPPHLGDRQNLGTLLILYGLNESKTENNLIKFEMDSQLDLKNLIQTKKMNIIVGALFLYQSSDFYQIIKRCLSIINKTAKSKYKLNIPKDVEQKMAQDIGDHQILQAKNISEQFQFNASIQRLNIIALHQATPIFTFSLLGITIKHVAELYVTKYLISTKQFYVVDISPHCGLHPIVFKSKEMICSFTKYQSQLLKEKQHKSAFLKIKFKKAEIQYLNRKIKEITNFIMSHFQEQQEQAEQLVQKEQNQKKQIKTKTYPFCYKIQMVNPVIVLLRNSLSFQKFIGEAEKITIHNDNFDKQEDNVNNEQYFFQNGDNRQYKQCNDSFQSCQQINESQIQYYSFTKEGQETQVKPTTIFIKMGDFKIFNQDLDRTDKAVIYIPEIVMTLVGKDLNAGISQMELCLTENDYRLLIRFTQQNFSEVPVSFPKDSFPTQNKLIGFRSKYKVNKLIMLMKINKKSEIFGEFVIQNICGQNILYTNGEKLDEITIQGMNYQSYFKNQLETIIKMKQKQDDYMEKQQKSDYPQASTVIETFEAQKILKTNKFNNYLHKFQNQQIELNLNDCFKDTQGYIFKFDSDKKQKAKKRESSIIGAEGNEKEQTKIQKVGKWLGGMCQKCMCCLKKKQQKKQVDLLEESQLIKNKSIKQIGQILQKQFFQKKQTEFNWEQSLIEDEDQIIDFQKKINPDDYHRKNVTVHPIYLHIVGQKNKQKRMYMLVQHLIIYYQKNQHIMQLINFLNKPYSETEKPEYVKQAKFNNYKPFQMLVELTDTSFQAIHKDITGELSINLDVNMVYNFQKRGDQNKGPGKKLMSVDLLCNLSFCNIKNHVLPLSNQMRIFWQKDSKIAYRQKQPVMNKQWLILSGFGKKQQSNKETKQKVGKKGGYVEEPVTFNLPISHLKEINQLISKIFKKQQEKKDQQLMKKEKRKVLPKRVMSLVDNGYQKDLLFRNKKYSQTPKMLKQLDLFKISSKQNQKSKQNQISKSIQDQQKMEMEKRELQIKQKQKERTNNIKNNNQKIKTVKVYFIPALSIGIETKIKSSYLKLDFNNIEYQYLNGTKSLLQACKQIINFQTKIDYFNLHNVKFEPFLEQTMLHIDIQNYKIQNNENKVLKILSSAEKDKNTRDYKKGLSINFSTALYHTVKELHLKYQLGNQDMEIMSEKCFDLTTKDTRVYSIMLKKTKQQFWHKDQKLFKSNTPDLKNFFGKKFIIDNKYEVTKKKSKKKQNRYKRFHIQGLRIFLYHSFMEAKTKLKNIVYRTPFRIINLVEEKITLKLNFELRNNKRYSNRENWGYDLDFKQYYTVPADIYNLDFLVSIIAAKKSKKGDQSNRVKVQQQKQQEFNLRSTFIRDSVKVYNSLMSAKYVFQTQALIDDYHPLGKNKLTEYLFDSTNLQNRYIDKRDILIRSKNLTLTLVNVKTDCDQLKDKQSQNKITFYDSLTVVMSPIIVFNFTQYNLLITCCRKKKIQIPKGKKVSINQFPDEVQFKDITIEFSEDIVHHQYRFFDSNFHVDKQSKFVIKKLLIDRMQSLNLKIIKQTYNTCIIEIYPDWIICNKTEMQFQLEYHKKEFPVDRNASSSLAFDEETNHAQDMKIKLYDNENPSEQFHKFITQTDTLDIFTLVQVETSHMIFLQKAKILSEQVHCCGSKKATKFSYLQKSNDNKPYQCIEFVLSIQQSSHYELTKELIINYKYDIVNSMEYQMTCYQSNGAYIDPNQKNRDLELFKLNKNEIHYLYSYDFLPKIYYISINLGEQKFISNYFTCDAKTSQSFSLKLRAQHSSTETYYVRVDLNQNNFINQLNFRFINDKDVQHPFYIKNQTNYIVKITENGQSFRLQKKHKNPFVWSNLINNEHEIEIQIEGVSKKYSLKQNSEFEPIIIKGDRIDNDFVKHSQRELVKRQVCRVKWLGVINQYEVIYDMFYKRLQIIGQEKAQTFQISKIQRIKTQSNRIQLMLKNGKSVEIYPTEANFKEWNQLLSRDIDSDMVDKIYFTIESLENSMIFFIHNVDISSDNNLQLYKQEYIIQNLYISIIRNNIQKAEEILLINMEDIQYLVQNRVSQINQFDQNYKMKKLEHTFRIKKLKINNQLFDAVNPVILSQIKKSKYPFLQFKKEKQTLVQQINQLPNKQEIDHYKTTVFFLDEAQLVVQASLFPKLLNIKKYIQEINRNYSIEMDNQVHLPEHQHQKKNNTYQQIYINYMEIKPIKMTISVNFQSTQAMNSSKLMNFLSLIPAGVENAIITIDSFIFHHVFLEEKLIKKTLQQYYMYQMKKQIVYNAGSIQFFAPLQLIQGLGIGFTNIFYNPLYNLVSTQQIKTFTSTFLQGVITFFVFIVTTLINFVSIIFKLIAFLTFDRLFQSKRQMFRKQIFKSPVDGFNYGGRYLIKVLKQFFINFTQWPCYYHRKFPCIGLFIGFLLCILNVFPWLIKVLVTIFDFFYVIFQGLINWGHYEQNSMKYRSRPIRTFPHQQMLPYDYLTAKGNQIMRKNQIEQNDNEFISFISYIDEGDESRYLVLSNYRILYCSYQLLSFKEIQLYKILKVQVSPLNKNEQQVQIKLVIDLRFADKVKYFCCESSVEQYQIKFKDIKKLKELLDKLKKIMEDQKIIFTLNDSQLQEYQKYRHKIIMM